MKENLPLFEVIAAQKRHQPRGIYSVCSANQFVLEAAARFSAQTGTLLLVESTCNQVNQYGGYTGMTPEVFVTFVREIAARQGLPQEQLILGGDHLGPIPWQNESFVSAMSRGQQLVREYVLAGYTKIHLDASIRCADDQGSALDKVVAAERAAQLCQVAEMAQAELPAGSPPPFYVIGTEVPLPGGAPANEDMMQVTKVDDALEDIHLTRKAFLIKNLAAAWERVIALVVQPGVEFSDSVVYAYDRVQAAPLVKFIELEDDLIFEAHSTDYQTVDALSNMVEDHFAILKVGPALTFAFREAIFALAWMEEEWLGKIPGVQLSHLPDILEQVMLSDPGAWQKHYHGNEAVKHFARKYSYSDRSRYYWATPHVKKALNFLLTNLEQRPLPPTLLSQFMPVQYERMRAGKIPNAPLEWVYDKIKDVLKGYATACRLVE